MILRHGLVFRKRSVNASFRFINQLIRWFRPSKLCPVPTNPRKILLSNLGNIGDLFIAAKAIASLQSTYPNAEWGLLISERSKSALDLLESFKTVHFFEPSLSCKAVLQRRKIIREIENQRYDMAIDLHPFYPNAVTLLRASKIPVRLGYDSGGFGALLTHPFRWTKFENYLGDLHLDHLRQRIPLQEGVYQNKGVPFDHPEEYLILHMCSSRVEKDWKREKWIELIRKLSDWTVVLTGHGVKDKEECEKVAAATHCLNFCNQTSMTEYAALLQKAKAVITVDSMGVHLATLLSVPTLVLFSDVEHPPLWLPPSATSLAMDDDSIEKIVTFVHNLTYPTDFESWEFGQKAAQIFVSGTSDHCPKARHE